MQHKVRLYRGSVTNIASEFGYMGVRNYEFVLLLKTLFPYSYIHNWESKITHVAKQFNLDRRTVKSRISRIIENRFAYIEGDTLRLLSNTFIKKRYAVRKANKNIYVELEKNEVCEEVRLQPYAENIKKQEQAFKVKTRKVSSQLAKCESIFRDDIKRNPTFRTDRVNTTLLSQQKAAHLLGYRSKSSGQRQLKRLSMSKRLVIESNMVELSYEQFKAYKLAYMPRLLIKGQGNKAKFYFCVANTVRLNKQLNKRKSNGEQVYSTSKFFDSDYF